MEQENQERFFSKLGQIWIQIRHTRIGTADIENETNPQNPQNPQNETDAQHC